MKIEICSLHYHSSDPFLFLGFFVFFCSDPYSFFENSHYIIQRKGTQLNKLTSCYEMMATVTQLYEVNCTYMRNMDEISQRI